MKILIENSEEVNGFNIYMTLIELHKSYLLLISDQKDMGIGDVSLGSPPIVEGWKSPTTSFKLFGVENKLLSTIIVERASSILKAPVLLLLFLKINKKEEEIVKPIVNLLNKALTKVKEKKNDS